MPNPMFPWNVTACEPTFFNTFLMRFAYTTLILLISLGIFSACNSPVQVKLNTSVNNAGDSAAIADTLKKLLVSEGQSFYSKDLARWADHFVHTPDVYWLCVEDGVTLRARGWDDLQAFVAAYMKENPQPESPEKITVDQLSNFQLQANGKLAFLHFTQTKTDAAGNSKQFMENRVFVHRNGAWKILGMTSAPAYDSPGSSKNVFMHVPAK